ncbi:hypothetical protein GPECTOR_21g681 [Gonium pectorale]|uniref:non-specific serine/threonine protein kinase n=1 Tax=Gonium pectorale TaxID=33097 RepID=A0A150GIF4_GONPE|nr:hypothetical protein GPECTOR_21g681 [Gonium pectorale]|eukprot:KXZ49455.1 hypothetical protein GPECTOR_21g681 [Gonium pectorale]
MQNYLVVKKLGTGTYGSAYLVTLRANPNQQYVLKKVKVEGGDVSADSEVKVLRSLCHPLVLSYVDHFMYKGHLCIVTEYCDAGDLFQLLRSRKSPLSEPQLLDFFAQVLLAIQHVHSKNILHRDLKTQNIFLTSGGSIRLGDFGISRPLNGTMDLASTIIGTPYYMSPEVMSSMPYDFKSDMWSLGCVLYEMMSLKHAFDATDMSSLVMKILRGEHLPIPQGYSQELKDLVRQLLCKNPKMRPSPDQMLKMPFLKANGLSPSQLDRELEAAKERLRRIQIEREALQKQARMSQRELQLPSPPLTAAGQPPGSSGGYSASPFLPHLAGDVDAALERHRELRQLRSSRPQSPEILPGSSAGGTGASPPGGVGTVSLMDPKMRMKARKEEEARRREAELLHARKAYFEERKQAQARLQQLYTPSPFNQIATTARRVTDSSQGTPDYHQRYSSPHLAPGNSLGRGGLDAALMREASGVDGASGGGGGSLYGGYPSSAGPPQRGNTSGLAISDSDEDDEAFSGSYGVCAYNLGQPLYELIYGYIRKRMAQGLTDDAAFRTELLQRLGPGRMQYVHLLDQLIYFEDLHSKPTSSSTR